MFQGLQDNINLNMFNRSKFRMQFKLDAKHKDYVSAKGIEVIKQHAWKFIEQRLKPKIIYNDGKQTPYKNHPVFIAQHATATCCRKCLEKWHKIPQHTELTNDEISYIVSYIIKWIQVQIEDDT